MTCKTQSRAYLSQIHRSRKWNNYTLKTHKLLCFFSHCLLVSKFCSSSSPSPERVEKRKNWASWRKWWRIWLSTWPIKREKNKYILQTFILFYVKFLTFYLSLFSYFIVGKKEVPLLPQVVKWQEKKHHMSPSIVKELKFNPELLLY